MTNIKIATANILVDLSNAKMQEDVRSLIQADVEIMALQEVGANDRTQYLEGLDAWGSHTEGRSSGNPILWRKDTFVHLDSGSSHVSDERVIPQPGGDGTRTFRSQNIPWVKLKHRNTNRILFVLNNHCIAHHEDHGAPTDAAWAKETLELYRLHMSALQDLIRNKRDHGMVFITGDFNVNFRLDRNVKHPLYPYARMQDVNVTSNWLAIGTPDPEDPSISGTIKSSNRLIDYVMWRRSKAIKPVRQRIMGINSDHHAVIVTVDLTDDATVPDNSEEEPNPPDGQTPPPVEEPTDPETGATIPKEGPFPPVPPEFPVGMDPADPFNQTGRNPEKRRFRDYTYSYFLVDTVTEEIVAELPFVDVSWSASVSSAGEFSGSITVGNATDIDLYWATMPKKRAIYVMREGVTVWGGPIWSRTYQAQNQQVTISAASWESYLYRRYIWHTMAFPAGTDQYDVVRGLLAGLNTDFSTVVVDTDHVTPRPNNANMNIEYETRLSGQIQETDSQKWIGTEMRSFGDAIAEFANNLNGFEWNINCSYDPYLHIFRKIFLFRDAPPNLIPANTPYLGTRPGLDKNFFELPGNIMAIDLEESGDESATRFFVVGGAPEGVNVDDSYKPRGVWNNGQFLDANWPVVETVESSRHSTVASVDRLDGYAKVYGQRAKPPIPTWNVTVNGSLDPVIGSYEVGEWCRLIVNDNFMKNKLQNKPYNSEPNDDNSGMTKRIMGYSVSIPNVPQYPETVTLELADEWNSDA